LYSLFRKVSLEAALATVCPEYQFAMPHLSLLSAGLLALTNQVNHIVDSSTLNDTRPVENFILVGSRKPSDDMLRKIGSSFGNLHRQGIPSRLMVIDSKIKGLKVILREEDLGLLALKVKLQLFQEILRQRQGPFGTITIGQQGGPDLEAILDVAIQTGESQEAQILKQRKSQIKLNIGVESNMVFAYGEQKLTTPIRRLTPGTLERIKKSLNTEVSHEERIATDAKQIERWGNPTEIRFDFGISPRDETERVEMVSIASKIYLDTFKALRESAKRAEQDALESLKTQSGWPSFDDYRDKNPRELFINPADFASELARSNPGSSLSTGELSIFANQCTFDGVQQSLSFRFLFGNPNQNPLGSFAVVKVVLPP
jgi:hypothetical protein